MDLVVEAYLGHGRLTVQRAQDSLTASRAELVTLRDSVQLQVNELSMRSTTQLVQVVVKVQVVRWLLPYSTNSTFPKHVTLFLLKTCPSIITSTLAVSHLSVLHESSVINQRRNVRNSHADAVELAFVFVASARELPHEWATGATLSSQSCSSFRKRASGKRTVRIGFSS